MMHFLDMVVKSHKIAEDTYTMGYSWSKCSYLVPHDHKEELMTLTKDTGLVDCPDCLLAMLGDS